MEPRDRGAPFRPPGRPPFAPLPDHDRLVSVLVRTRDRPTLLPRALASILAQDTPPAEVVIANDGGDPAPVEAAAEAFAGSGIAVVLRHAPRPEGRFAAAAAAHAASSGPLLALLDDDDSWEPGFLAATLARFRAPDAACLAAVHSWWRTIEERPDGDGRMETLSGNVVRIGRPPYTSLARLLQPANIQPQAVLIRREALERAGGWDPALKVGGDWEFHLRLAAEGEIGVVPRPLANWHLRRSVAPGTSPLANATSAAADYDAFHTAYWNRQVRAMLHAGPEMAATALLLGQIRHGQASQMQRVQAGQAAILARLERIEALLAAPDAGASVLARLETIERLLGAAATPGDPDLRPAPGGASMRDD